VERGMMTSRSASPAMIAVAAAAETRSTRHHHLAIVGAVSGR